MPNESALNEVMPRRVMTLFLLVDCSGSMSINGNIGKVNGAIEEMRPLLKEVSDENADAEIKIAVLAFPSERETVWPTICSGKTRPMANIASAEKREI